MKKLRLAFLVLLFAATAPAAVKTETIAYKDGEVECKGFLAYDDAKKDKRPAVLIVHEWWGLGDFVKENAQRLAEQGYVAFSVDMYGGGLYTENKEEAAAKSGEMKKNPDKSKARFAAALEALKARPEVDAERIGAMGYCFGGTTVLDMARLGLGLKGVVSFHGALATSVPSSKEALKAAVLVCHGNDDPFVPAEEVAAFKKEMGERRAVLKFIGYPGTVHSFTNPGVDKHGIDGAKYNKAAADHAWKAMLDFFGDTL